MIRRSMRQNIEEKLKDLRVRIYSILIFTFAVVTILLLFAIQPSLASISSHYEQLKVLKEQDQTLKTNYDNMVSIVNVYYEQVQGLKLDFLNDSLPSTQSTGHIFANINNIAIADKINLQSINFSLKDAVSTTSDEKDVVTDTSATKLFVRISGTAQYDQIQNFIKDLEDYPRVISIEELTFNNQNAKKQNTGSLSDNVLFSMNVYIYYIKKSI